MRIGLGDVRGRLERLGGEVDEQGSRLIALTGEVETRGREVRKDLRELPAQLLAGVMAGIERSDYATDLLKHDVAELKRAAGE